MLTTDRVSPSLGGGGHRGERSQLRHHWQARETDDPAVTMFIGPSTAGEPLEVGVVTDDEGTSVIHAMRARPKFLKGWWTR
jgi:hypothetical protein